MKDFSKYSAIIIGAGDATGSAITKKFASHGYKVCPARRPRNTDKLDELSSEILNQEGGLKDLELMPETKIQLLSFLKKLKKKLLLLMLWYLTQVQMYFFL